MKDENAKYKLSPKMSTFAQDMEDRCCEGDNEGSKFSQEKADIKVCTLNIDKLTEEKVQFIAWFIEKIRSMSYFSKIHNSR